MDRKWSSNEAQMGRGGPNRAQMGPSEAIVKLAWAQWDRNSGQRGPSDAQVWPSEGQMEPNRAQVGGKMATECIPKSIERSIPLPIACKCHFEATLELQKVSKSAWVLDKSRPSTVATRRRGISEIRAFSQRKTMILTTQPWRSSMQFKQTRTPKRSSLSHHKPEAFVTPFRHQFGSIRDPFGSQIPSKMHVKLI